MRQQKKKTVPRDLFHFTEADRLDGNNQTVVTCNWSGDVNDPVIYGACTGEVKRDGCADARGDSAQRNALDETR